MNNKKLIERIVEYEKKWNIEDFNSLYKNDNEAMEYISQKIEQKSDLIFQDFAIDLAQITRNPREIKHEDFKKQLYENIEFLVEIHKLLYGGDNNE